MIKTTITVHNARTGKRERVADITIWNTGAGNPAVGQYKYVVELPGEEQRHGVVGDFDRNTPHGAAVLAGMVMAQEFARPRATLRYMHLPTNAEPGAGMEENAEMKTKH